jgi:hypothetical protein
MGTTISFTSGPTAGPTCAGASTACGGTLCSGYWCTATPTGYPPACCDDGTCLTTTSTTPPPTPTLTCDCTQCGSPFEPDCCQSDCEGPLQGAAGSEQGTNTTRVVRRDHETLPASLKSLHNPQATAHDQYV